MVSGIGGFSFVFSLFFLVNITITWMSIVCHFTFILLLLPSASSAAFSHYVPSPFHRPNNIRHIDWTNSWMEYGTENGKKDARCRYQFSGIVNLFPISIGLLSTIYIMTMIPIKRVTLDGRFASYTILRWKFYHLFVYIDSLNEVYILVTKTITNPFGQSCCCCFFLCRVKWKIVHRHFSQTSKTIFN